MNKIMNYCNKIQKNLSFDLCKDVAKETKTEMFALFEKALAPFIKDYKEGKIGVFILAAAIPVLAIAAPITAAAAVAIFPVAASIVYLYKVCQACQNVPTLEQRIGDVYVAWDAYTKI